MLSPSSLPNPGMRPEATVLPVLPEYHDKVF